MSGKLFFTADEHYGHKNIIRYCNRPFSSVDVMDKVLIDRHNTVVGWNDIVIHAGDFTLQNTEAALKIIAKLNGVHIFLKGSHDYWLTSMAHLHFGHIWEKRIKDLYVVVCHYPMRSWPRSFHGSFNLHGHCHGRMEPLKNQLDIGVDNCDYYPLSLEQAIRDIKRRG